MVESSLQDDLLGILGVESAEVDGSGGTPAGLRIRIAEGADQQAVGAAIRRVLSSHGLGTDTQLPGESIPDTPSKQQKGAVAVLTEEGEQAESSPEAAEDEGRAVIDLTGNQPGVTARASVADSDGDEQLSTSVSVESSKSRDLPSFVEGRPKRDEPGAVAATLPKTSPGGVARLEKVTVEEGRSGIVVTVSASDGTEVSQIASSTEGGVETAVIKAAANLIDPSAPDPIVVNVDDRRVEGVDIVMIVLDVGGVLMAGSSIVAAGRAFALGRATWAAVAL